MKNVYYLIMTGLLLISPFLHATSFDCDKARRATEKAICDNVNLDEADTRLGDLYVQLQKSLSTSEAKKLAKEEEEWVKQRDTTCSSSNDMEDCLVKLYEARILVLSGKLSALKTNSKSTLAANSASAGKLNKDSKVLLRSVGPIEFGMEISKAELVTGLKFKREQPNNDEENCIILTPKGVLEDYVNFIAIDDIIVSANIFSLNDDSNGMKTKSGIGIGSSEKELRKKYSGNIELNNSGEIEGLKYKILSFVPNDEKDENYRIIFHLSQDEEQKAFIISHFSVGQLPQVDSGCFEDNN